MVLGRGCVRLAASVAIMSAVTMGMARGAAEAAEIRVFCANGMKLIMADVATRFESATGHKLIVTRGEAGVLRRRILEGDGFDVALLPAQSLRDLATLNKVAAGSMVDVAR